LKTIISGIDILINSINKLFDKRNIYLFLDNCECDYNFQSINIKIEKINVIKNKTELFKEFFGSDKRKILITVSNVLSEFKENYGLASLLALLRRTLVICIDYNHSLSNELSDFINNDKVVSIIPSFLYEIPISLRIASNILENESASTIFVFLNKILLNLFEEVDLEILDLIADKVINIDDIFSFEKNNLNMIIENESHYVIIATGLVYRDIFSYLFERNKLTLFSLIKIGFFSRRSLRELIKLLKERDYVLLINSFDYLKRMIEEYILEFFYRGEIEHIPVIISNKNLALIPDNEILALVEELIKNVKYGSYPWGFISNNFRLLYPIEPALIALTFFLNKIGERQKLIIMIPNSLSRIIKMPSKVPVIAFKKLIDLLPILSSMKSDEANLNVLVLLDNVPFRDIHELSMFGGSIDLVFLIRRRKETDIIEFLSKALKKEVIKLDYPSDLSRVIDEISLRSTIISISLKDHYDNEIENIYIDQSKCIKCYDCMKYTLCPAISSRMNDSLLIDSIICRKCSICAFTCRYNAIIIVKKG